MLWVRERLALAAKQVVQHHSGDPADCQEGEDEKSDVEEF